MIDEKLVQTLQTWSPDPSDVNEPSELVIQYLLVVAIRDGLSVTEIQAAFEERRDLLE